MSAQVGIPKYNDLLNANYLDSLKDKISKICLFYGKLANKDSIENRESDNFNTYIDQYNKDMTSVKELCGWSQQLLNELNNILYMISTRSVQNHIFPEE